MSFPSANPVAGPAALALAALTESQVAFLESLPKAELHAHLNGSIPIDVLQELAKSYKADERAAGLQSLLPAALPEEVQSGLERLAAGVELPEINDFFGLFPAIYAITSTRESLKIVTKSVLDSFLSGTPRPQCDYLEIRTTPRATPSLSKREYLKVVLDELDAFDGRATLIVSLDRRMSLEVLEECLGLAISLKAEGRRVVGVDLCGDPLAGDMTTFTGTLSRAREAGLGVTLHIAETLKNPPEETLTLLGFGTGAHGAIPHRLGHATFLNDAAKEIVRREGMAVELCLSSNILCKTVNKLDDHHVLWYLKHELPLAICTDDTLPFRTSLLAEYALLLAPAPYGLALSENEVRRVAELGLKCAFGTPKHQ